jgi:hypothetical protein
MDKILWDAVKQPLFPPGTIFHFRDIGLLHDVDSTIMASEESGRYWKVQSELGSGQVRVYKVVRYHDPTVCYDPPVDVSRISGEGHDTKEVGNVVGGITESGECQRRPGMVRS